MKKILVFIVTCAISLCFSMAYAGDNDDRHTIWYASSLNGGGTGALDGAVSGVSIGPKDAALVSDTISGASVFYIYYVTLTSEAEDAPNVIRPDDVAGGITSWRLAVIGSGVSTIGTIVGGVSVYNITTSTTATREMMGGSFIGNYGASSEVTLTMLPAFKGASCNISLDQDKTSGSTLWVVFNAADKIINKPDFATGAGAGTSYYYLSGTTGAASISLVGKAANKWRVWEEGSPTQGTR